MKANLKAKRFVAALVAVMMLIFSASVLYGCGQSDEDVIREALTSEFEGIKNQDETFMSTMASNLDAEDFTTYGIDPQEFMAKYLAGFDYSIDSITVEEGTASAVITMTCKSFNAYKDAVKTSASDALATTDFSNMTEADLNAFVGEIMMSALDGAEPVTCAPVTIEYTLDGATWTPTAASKQVIAKAMLAN